MEMNIYKTSKISYRRVMLYVVLWNYIMTEVVQMYKYVEDQKFIGDIFQVLGGNIYTLSWVIKLSSKCDINKILNQYRNCKDPIYEHFFNTSKCNIMILKTLKPFRNTFLIAHPYYRFFKKLKTKIIRNHKYLVLNSSTLPINFRVKSYLLRGDRQIFYNTEECITNFLTSQSCIRHFTQEILRPRMKRSILQFDDPLFKDQWHLKNDKYDEYDINVIGAWESGISGQGVTVCVIDDGLEWRHPDLIDNYNPRGSYDLNADDFDPSPVKNGGYELIAEKNEHGTRCAGEIAAVANHICGVGVAYRANISGIRVLGERMTDSMEAIAFIQGLSFNDIYSCSWGPNDDGKTVDGPHYLAKKALLHGITYGRSGYGSIYVVASGNGGKNKDNCNFDGYANSLYTITIGAVDSRGTMPYYAEECATMLAVTPSSGNNGKAIVTTDWQGSSKSGCTFQHSGTSAAAPLAAAIIALALEMQPCLSWRDVQYLIALTSRKIDVANSDWIVNKAGLHHSHQHGFGLVDATGMVSAAAVWESVPFLTSFRSNVLDLNQVIPAKPFQKLIVNHTIEKFILERYALNLLEFVQVYISIEHECRGSLKIELVCPSGTKSVLASPRINDNSSNGLKHWPLGTVRCWGEIPYGIYTVSLEHTHTKNLKGKLISMEIALHGSPMTSSNFKQRKITVTRAIKGEVVHVNRSLMCHAPQINFRSFYALSDQVVKILVITGIFFFLMTIYNTLEYIFFYNNEKKKLYQFLKDLIHSQSLMLSTKPSSRESLGSIENQEESFSLLETNLMSSQNIKDTGNCSLEDDLQYQGYIERCLVSSPTPSWEADVSSLSADSDNDDITITSRNTSDTVIPRETDVTTTTTDFTTDNTTSEA